MATKEERAELRRLASRPSRRGAAAGDEGSEDKGEGSVKINRRALVWMAVIAVGVVLLLVVVSFFRRKQAAAAASVASASATSQAAGSAPGAAEATPAGTGDVFESVYVNTPSTSTSTSYNQGMPTSVQSGLLSPAGPTGMGANPGHRIPLQSLRDAGMRGNSLYVTQPADTSYHQTAARLGTTPDQLRVVPPGGAL